MVPARVAASGSVITSGVCAAMIGKDGLGSCDGDESCAGTKRRPGRENRCAALADRTCDDQRVAVVAFVSFGLSAGGEMGELGRLAPAQMALSRFLD